MHILAYVLQLGSSSLISFVFPKLSSIFLILYLSFSSFISVTEDAQKANGTAKVGGGEDAEVGFLF